MYVLVFGFFYKDTLLINLLTEMWIWKGKTPEQYNKTGTFRIF